MDGKAGTLEANQFLGRTRLSEGHLTHTEGQFYGENGLGRE